MGRQNVPNIPDWDTLRATDMNPRTGERNTKNNAGFTLLDTLKTQMRVLDQQNFCNRYTWYNLPSGLNGQFIERVLYYKGQGALFYIPEESRFYFLPYTLNGTIDVYGRYTAIKPLPFTGKSETDKEVFIPGLVLTPQYEVVEDLDLNIFENGCVLLSDYTKQYSQKVIPRKDLQEPILNIMAECFPLARTSLIANSGVRTMKVDDPDQGWIVEAASQSIYAGALSDLPQPLVPIASDIKVEDLTNSGSGMKGEEFLLMMQAIDNFRLSLLGLKNGGLFQKKAHMLEAEQEMNNGYVGLVYQDGLTNRQRFCDIVNSIWGLGIWCDVSECVVGVDRNRDMIAADEQDQTGNKSGEQPVINEGGSDGDA